MTKLNSQASEMLRMRLFCRRIKNLNFFSKRWDKSAFSLSYNNGEYFHASTVCIYPFSHLTSYIYSMGQMIPQNKKINITNSFTLKNKISELGSFPEKDDFNAQNELDSRGNHGVRFKAMDGGSCCCKCWVCVILCEICSLQGLSRIMLEELELCLLWVYTRFFCCLFWSQC